MRADLDLADAVKGMLTERCSMHNLDLLLSLASKGNEEDHLRLLNRDL